MVEIMGGETGDVPVRTRPLRRAEYQYLLRSGTLDEERVELLGGALVEVGEGEAHDQIVERIAGLLRARAAPTGRVYIGESLAQSDFSMPRPDLMLWATDGHWSGDPRVRLIIEVAGRSLDKDRVLKAQLYAAAAVDEYWIVDLGSGTIEVCAQRDRVMGLWGSRVIYGADEVVALGGDPAIRLTFSELRATPLALGTGRVEPPLARRGGARG